MERKVYEFISKSTHDPIIERKTCAVSGQDFAIFQSDLDFYEKVSPTFKGKKYQIPAPTLCPTERLRRRMTWRNERNLYRRKCDLTGKEIISIYSPDKPFPVYSTKEWRSDHRDAFKYGQDIDLNTSFFKQFASLHHNVPKLAIMNDDGVGSENCAYTNDFSHGKNCYMCFGTLKNEDCCYTDLSDEAKNTVDIVTTYISTRCYECTDNHNIHNCIYTQYSTDSSHCHFCFEMQGCSYCLFCTNLRNKQYHIFNKPCSKVEYRQTYDMLMKRLTTERERILEEFHEFLKSNPMRALSNTGTQNSISNASTNLYGTHFANDCFNLENCGYMYATANSKDSYDIVVSTHNNLCYEAIGPDHSFNVLFSTNCRKDSYVYYSDNCHGCSHCFGCVGLRHKHYCIFNKQYTQSEYEMHVPQIIEKMKADGEWGEFFPSSLSPFGYNETVAQELFPLNAQEASKQGFQRSQYDAGLPEVKGIMFANDLPDIQDASDEIVKQAIQCEISGKPFRLVKLELDFYRKLKLPLPRRHPNQRHLERTQRRPKKFFHLRTCDKCGIEILSVYPSESEFKVFCESCYNKEIYG